jgi:hypothetical protein
MLKIMNKNVILLVLLLLVQMSAVYAQNDTLKVGLNDQLIQVDAPNDGQKITVLIEDSTFTYKVEISKLENKSLEEQLKNLTSVSKKKKKPYSSSWFNSGEVGFNTLTAKTFYTSSSSFAINLNDSSYAEGVNYTRRSYNSNGEYWGAYLDFTIRERTRSSERLEKLYLKRKSHVRLDFNTVKGELHFDNYFGNGVSSNDSFISGSSREQTISFTNLQLSQLLTYGYMFNKDKGVSLEYGVNLGLQFALSSNNDESVNISEDNSINTFNIFNKYVANPFMRVQHHAAYNYGPYSLNAKLTFLGKRFGSNEKNHVSAHILSMGIGYKF